MPLTFLGIKKYPTFSILQWKGNSQLEENKELYDSKSEQSAV